MNVRSQPYLQISIPDPDARDDDELDSISAMPIKDHLHVGVRKWLVGHECSGIYFSIYQEEIDSWIEMFQAMKEYEG